MSDVRELERLIGEKLHAAEATRKTHAEHLRQRMDEAEQRTRRFGDVARPLMERVIHPRMQVLARSFDNAELLEPHGAAWNHCICVFRHTARFPATVTLDLSLCPDDDLSHLLAVYRLEILPEFFQYAGRDQKAFSLMEALSELELTVWVNARLESFVDTYLRLEHADAYQRENMVRDPVCGMPINRNWAAATAEYEGRTFHFCIEACRDRFEADPKRYVQGKQ